MQITKINPQYPEPEIIQQAVNLLKRGGAVVYPTDTAYALGVDALNSQAVKKIFFIKNRSPKKPIAVIAKDIVQVRRIAFLDRKSLYLIKKYWPGPLTIILPKKKIVPADLTAGFKKIGVRIPDNEIACLLCKKLGHPISATSANLSGKRMCYNARAVLKQFVKREYQPDLILDAGSLNRVKPSTLVEIRDGKFKILRSGSIEFGFLRNY